MRGINDVDDQAAQLLLAAAVGSVLPASSALIAAVRAGHTPRPLAEPLLTAVTTLVAQHRRQWRAEDETRNRSAPADLIAAGKRRIDRLNARRVALVELIDDWVAHHVPQRAEGTLHTETFGSVVDRLVIACVRCENLAVANNRAADAEAAEIQLGELALAYDDLVGDVLAGRRRLPEWRSLKSYRDRS